ncbi:hypothetical protein L9F63_009217, partial [Diploptera punctata]
VNPAEPPLDINDGKWEQKEATLPPQRGGVISSPAEEVISSTDNLIRPDDLPPDLPGNNSIRKSSKAKRVKSYLKKCRDAALGNTSSSHNEDNFQDNTSDFSVEQENHDSSRIRKRQSNSGNRDVSSTSWYVTSDIEPIHDNLVSVVEVCPSYDAPEHENTTVIEVNPDDVQCSSLSTQDGPGDVLDSRNEGGTTIIVLETQTKDHVVNDSDPNDIEHEEVECTLASDVETEVVSVAEDGSNIGLLMEERFSFGDEIVP